MERPTLFAGARASGVAALTTLLLYGGFSLARPGVSGPEATLWVVFGLLLAFLGLWGLERMDVSTVAAALAIVVLGLGPIATFVGWLAVGGLRTGTLQGLLWLNLLVGLLTTGLVIFAIASGGPEARQRARIARAG